MISAKKILNLARKWQKHAAIKRKRITLLQTTVTDISSCSTSPICKKAHFVVYSADQKSFLLPLEYLNKEMIRQLFNMAEEEFGLLSERPLMLPCDAELMDYAIALIKQQVTRDVEDLLLMSISTTNGFCSLSFQDQTTSHQLPIYSF